MSIYALYRAPPVTSRKAMLITTLHNVLISLSLTVQPTAMTYHGVASDADLRAIRRSGTALDRDGRLTYHHGMGVTARYEHLQITGNYFKNSVNRNAGSIMAGPKLDFWGKHCTFGVVAGVYIRDPMRNLKIPGSYKSENIEVAPMAMLTVSAAIRIYKTLFLEIAAGTNYVLNFFAPGIRVDI